MQETLARSCGRARFSVQQEQRSYSSLSRSQQRGAAGVFGSRTAGTAGTAALPESVDCSANSVRDESFRVSPSVSGQHDILAGLEESNDPSKGADINGIERSSRFSRKISYNSGARMTGDAGLVSPMNCDRRTTIEKREEQQFGDRFARTRRWQDSGNKLPNDPDRTGKSRRANSTRNESSARCNKNLRPIGVATIETEAASRKKWWRFFKWLPDGGIFKFGNERRRYSRPPDTMIHDIESKREEYSMTAYYGRNDTEQRLVWNILKFYPFEDRYEISCKAKRHSQRSVDGTTGTFRWGA